MLVTSLTGAHTISHGGNVHEPVQGFTFDVPHDLGEHLLRVHIDGQPQWRPAEPDDLDVDDTPKASAPRRGRPPKPRP